MSFVPVKGWVGLHDVHGMSGVHQHHHCLHDSMCPISVSVTLTCPHTTLFIYFASPHFTLACNWPQSSLASDITDLRLLTVDEEGHGTLAAAGIVYTKPAVNLSGPTSSTGEPNYILILFINQTNKLLNLFILQLNRPKKKTLIIDSVTGSHLEMY